MAAKVTKKGTYNRPCHIGTVHLFDIGKAAIFGGKALDLVDLTNWDILIPLISNYDLRFPVVDIQTNPDARELFSEEVTAPYYPAIMGLSWADFEAPFYSAEWWKRLVQDFEQMDEPMNTLIYCEGGHGRTGTALSILAQLSGVVPDGMSPVAWVRQKYCRKAVESEEQLAYIANITGVAITDPPARWSAFYRNMMGY